MAVVGTEREQINESGEKPIRFSESPERPRRPRVGPAYCHDADTIHEPFRFTQVGMSLKKCRRRKIFTSKWYNVKGKSEGQFQYF